MKLIRKMKLTHYDLIMFCFIPRIDTFTVLTQFKFFFRYTVKLPKQAHQLMFFKVYLGELIFGREEGDCNKTKYIDHYTDNYFFCSFSMLVALFSDNKNCFP